MIAFPTNRDENWRYANLRPLANRRVEAMFLGIPFAGSDGAQARVVARAL